MKDDRPPVLLDYAPAAEKVRPGWTVWLGAGLIILPCLWVLGIGTWTFLFPMAPGEGVPAGLFALLAVAILFMEWVAIGLRRAWAAGVVGLLGLLLIVPMLGGGIPYGTDGKIVWLVALAWCLTIAVTHFRWCYLLRSRRGERVRG